MMQPNIKQIKFLNTREAEINGDMWIKRKSFTTEIEHLVNHVHFKVDGYSLHVMGNMCFKCGKVFDSQITSHHTLPKSIVPKYNVFIPLCEPCHTELNKLYRLGKV